MYVHATACFLVQYIILTSRQFNYVPPTANSCKGIIHLFAIMADFILIGTASLLEVGIHVRIKVRESPSAALESYSHV